MACLGGVDRFEAVTGSGDMDHAEEAFGELIISGGDGAVDFQAAEEAFGVVSLDLGLPPDPDGVDEGFAALAEILRLKPDTKVVVASGHGACEPALRAYDWLEWAKLVPHFTPPRRVFHCPVPIEL
jgi:hypothetical protein